MDGKFLILPFWSWFVYKDFTSGKYISLNKIVFKAARAYADMKVRIEVIDKNVKQADDVIKEIAFDFLDKYPRAEADLRGMESGNVEFLLD